MPPALLPDSLRDQLQTRMPDTIGDLRALARDHAPEAAARREAGYSIQNAAGAEAVVRIYDEIWWLGVNAQDFIAEIDTVTAPSMRVDINSPGGNVFDGIAIYNALRNHPAYVTTRVDGLAASIASVIAQAGDKRLIQASGQVMIHNASGVTVGDTNVHAEMADLLKQQDGVIANIYASRSGKPADGFRDLMTAETWMTAEAAVEAGLADEIFEPAPKEQPAGKARTLVDELSDATVVVLEAVTSAERVDALRTDAGKDLSNRSRECLVGLRAAAARIDALLSPNTDDDDTPAAWTDDDLALLRARHTAHARV